MDAWLVKSMTSRSMPMPSPAVGGMPYSRARRKSSSTTMGFFVSGLALRRLAFEPLALIERIIQL